MMREYTNINLGVWIFYYVDKHKRIGRISNVNWTQKWEYNRMQIDNFICFLIINGIIFT